MLSAAEWEELADFTVRNSPRDKIINQYPDKKKPARGGK